jgi:FG-GAP repeat
MQSATASRGTAARRSIFCLAAASICAAVASAQIPEAKLLASDGLPLDKFGSSVALLPEWAFCGAPFADPLGLASGAVYAYKFNGTNWVLAQKLLAGDSYDLMGYSVAASGSWMVAGAPYDNAPGYGKSGSAHVFQLQGGTWVHSQRLQASSSSSVLKFGGSAALSGDRMILGYGQSAYGRAFVFELTGSTWVQTAELASPDSGGSQYFGTAVDIEGDVAVVGSSVQENGLWYSKYGAAYVFERGASGTWSFAQKLTARDPKIGDQFGLSVALDGNTILVGSRHTHAAPSDGGIYVFERQTGTWVLTQELRASDPLKRPMMGEFVALDGDLAIGSAQNDGDNEILSGSAYVFRRQAGTWTQVAKAFAPDTAPNSLFGSAVAVCGEKILVACVGDDYPCLWNPLECNAGSAYVFETAPDAVQYCHCPSQGPCGNHDDFGGCATSLRRGGVLSAAGSASVAADDLRLEARWLPYKRIGVILMGDLAAAQPFGDGQLCIGSSGAGLWHFDPPQSSGLYGVIQIGPVVGLSASLPGGQIGAGQTRYFQAWFRDPNSLCGTDHNLSSAVRITFAP